MAVTTRRGIGKANRLYRITRIKGSMESKADLSMSNASIEDPVEVVAIIGMAGRFPGARTLAESGQTSKPASQDAGRVQ